MLTEQGVWAVESKVVIGVAGMPGAGKATLVEVAKRIGYGVVVMGNEVREEARRRNLEPTPENVGKVMLKVRAEGGSAVVARRCIPKIERMREKVVLVDGIRSLSEADAFKERFSRFKLVAIHSSPETRFSRLFRRKRRDDPASWGTFLDRDARELGVGVGSVIASADAMIVNEGDREELKKKVRKLLGRVAV